MQQQRKLNTVPRIIRCNRRDNVNTKSGGATAALELKYRTAKPVNCHRLYYYRYGCRKYSLAQPTG